jgi:DNA helicase-2/ATP-dependent DNA helicase PcrA
MPDPFDLSDVEPDVPVAAPARAGYLAALNDDQRTAVEAMDGPVLVLAGAGTGKTSVLTTRLAHIIETGRAHPSQSLTVTFTNKAAREMRDRVEHLLGRSVEGWFLGTFHSVAARILRRHAEIVGLSSNFTIIDTDDQIRLIKQLLSANDIDDKKWPARVLAGIISRWKDRGLTPDKVSGENRSEFANGRAVELYRQYQDRLATLNAADFGDLLLLNLAVFAADPAILADYQDRFRYLLVDEYQDTNVAQYLWLRLLAQKHKNICCVGDDDQSIYAWRGAEVGNILRFEHDFPGAKVVRLERNYRSTPHILGAASGLIAHNEGRLGKTLWTDANDGDKVRVQGTWDGEDEARTVAEEIESLQRGKHPLAEMAILVRASFQTRAFEERFIQIGLPYRVIGGVRFYERLEIRDAIAYLRCIAQPADDLAFERIVNKPKRGIGDASLQTMNLHARARGIPLLAAARELVESDELRGRARNALRKITDDLDRWRVEATTLTPARFAEKVLDESGYTEMWQKDKSVDAPGRLENLKELVTALDEFEDLEEFLEHVGLVMDTTRDSGEDMVNLMTLHGAKGLEFDNVFLPGWEEELFPNQRSLDEGGAAALEEERRLAYVGLTRARRRATVLHAANRLIFGRWTSCAPSRFVEELPADHVERHSVSGAYYGADSSANAFDASSFDRPTIGNRRSNWQRAAAAPATPTETHDHAPGTLAAGTRIFHQKFGYGLIKSVDGNKLEIAFDKAGTKKVMDSFVSLA